MPSLDATVIDITTEPPKQSKCGKSKESWTHARESTLLEDRMGSLEDDVSKAEEHCSLLLQHVGTMEEGQEAIEDSFGVAMATFCQQLEQQRECCNPLFFLSNRKY